MKKTFPLSVPGKHPERHIEAVKHELRKYLRRENRRTLPEGVDYWDFDCAFGPTPDELEAIQPGDVIRKVDAAVQAGWPAFHVVILVKPVTRPPRKPKPDPENL